MEKSTYYLTNDNLKKQMEERIERLKWVIKNKEKELEKAPAGNIRIVKKGKRVQYYLILEKGDTNGKYVPEKQKNMVQKILQRQYAEKVLPELEKQIKVLEKCNRAYKPEKIGSIYMLLKNGRKSFVESAVLEQSFFGERWLAEPYERKAEYLEALKLRTCYGEWVRSKSEVIIAEVLHKKKILFKYEYPVKLKEYTVYPDFYCLNLKTGEFLIWEHFGLLENAEYAAKSVKKIFDYQRSGYFLGKNLIISVESKDLPLSSLTVEQIVDAYF